MIFVAPAGSYPQKLPSRNEMVAKGYSPKFRITYIDDLFDLVLIICCYWMVMDNDDANQGRPRNGIFLRAS